MKYKDILDEIYMHIKQKKPYILYTECEKWAHFIFCYYQLLTKKCHLPPLVGVRLVTRGGHR
jgi:hypothetical protein